MKCAHCGEPNAGCNWKPVLCADKRKQRSKWLCDECDYELNEFVMTFFNFRNVEDKMREYANGMA